MSKFKTSNSSLKIIKAFQVDSLKGEDDIGQLCKFFLELKTDTNASIFIYSSPDTLLKSEWMNTIYKLIDKNIEAGLC